ncbi:MAG: hypothetical protein IPN79_10375 [Saprospiraceae bacterium]|nr:hypothetical protein [Saprospiraceae bacterium]
MATKKYLLNPIGLNILQLNQMKSASGRMTQLLWHWSNMFVPAKNVVIGDAPIQGCKWDKMISDDF